MAGVEIDAALVGRLISAQFPQWADLPVTPVENGGWDNRTFHLGERLIARLPSAAPYAAQVEKEQYWLPRLAPRLPLPIPTPVAIGTPDPHYPWPWSVYRWLAGETASIDRIADPVRLATDLAEFLVALQRIDPAGGPPPGPHNFYRGGPLSTYDAETRKAIKVLGERIDAEAASAVWDAALKAEWRGPPVWLHGDMTPGNLLLEHGDLSAVIDFGCCGVGDPACDLSIAWTLFNGPGRDAFRATLDPDVGALARGRGWTLWKALIVFAALPGANPLGAETSGRLIEDLISDYRSQA